MCHSSEKCVVRRENRKSDSFCDTLFCVIGNCDAISYYTKTLREDAQTAEMELIAAQYRGGARVLQVKLFVLTGNSDEISCYEDESY